MEMMQYKYISGAASIWRENHEENNRIFPYVIAVNVLEGTYTVKINEQILDVTGGQTIFIASNIRHDVWIKESCLFSQVYFVCHYSETDVLSISGDDYYIIEDADISEYMNQINRCDGESMILDMIHKDLLIASLMIRLFDICGFEKDKVYQDIWLCKVYSYVKNHISDPISVENMRAITGYSKTIFCEKFRQKTGLTPQKYVMKEKMNFAAMQLLKGGKVKEVALCVGFYDEIYFSKSFKKYFGISPAKYKSDWKMNKESGEEQYSEEMEQIYQILEHIDN